MTTRCRLACCIPAGRDRGRPPFHAHWCLRMCQSLLRTAQYPGLQGFWRNWHASFNLWLVRYMYVPLGGSAWRAANVWPIFTFVALWHDLEWRLLAWAWLSSLLLAPELVGATAWISYENVAQHVDRHLVV
jgi:D-alanyl-lipoteichoic acid acyltransferase DltB (MBOAT superfamily)